MPFYVATLRAIFEADHDAEANVIAEIIAENGQLELDGPIDDVFVTQVTSDSLDITPEETITFFKKTRNLLIKSRIKQCFEMAREFDKMIWILEHRHEPGFDLAGYDYGAFIELADEVLEVTKDQPTKDPDKEET